MSDIPWTGWIFILVVIYSVCVILLTAFGFNILGLVLLYLRTRRSLRPKPNPPDPSEWPGVTIQLPIYNESLIAERLLQAVTGQDYPHERVQIQVLDDSTDDTTEIARVLVARYAAEGHDIELLHRNRRNGYKAGALADAMAMVKWDFIAIFDADFVPPPNWLRSVMPALSDRTIGCVQTRWGHLNSGYNLLTEAQTLGIDGHFIVEQGARYGSRLFMGFNGSGGIWRKEAIETSGGWQSDTLTEDLDLSYRAQLNGWRILYMPEIVVPGELPAQIDAFKTQQFRWAKGSVQTLRKLGGTILNARLPLRIRSAALFHLSMYLPFPFMVLTLLLTLPVALWAAPVLKYFPWTILASIGPPLLYSVAKTSHLPRLRDRLARLPLLMIIGMGISLNTSLAVLEGLFQKGGEFRRTPKFALIGTQGTWFRTKYALPRSPVVWGELFLGLYAIFTVIVLWPSTIGKGMAPGMLLYAASYLFVAWLSFSQSWWQHRAKARVGKDSTTNVV